MRNCADLPCVAFGFFDAGTRQFIERWIARDGGFPADDCAQFVTAASRRLAEFAAVCPPEAAPGQAPERPGQSRSFPVWLNGGCCKVAVGNPVARTYPVVVLPIPATDTTAQLDQMVRLALAHVAQMLARYLYSRPVWSEDLVNATLRMLAIEFFMVSAEGEIVFDGRSSDEGGDGIWLLRNNRLALRDVRERSALDQAIRDAAGNSRAASIVSMTSEADQVRFAAVAPVGEAENGLALVLFEKHGTDHHALRDHFFRAYGLTRSEALVADEVLDGMSLAETAAKLNLSLETVRSYMKQVLGKTGTHRQSGLIALYYGSILPVGRSIARSEVRRMGDGAPTGRPGLGKR